VLPPPSHNGATGWLTIAPVELTTERLLLRQWRDDDLEPFAALNADPEVMRYFPAPLTPAQSEETAGYIRAMIDRQGWGLWAVEVRGGAPFIGFVGLNRPTFEADFMPTVEVGWRLDRPYWSRGYATEAAAASLTFAFDQLRCPEIVAFTAVANERSRRVMQRLGMSHDPADDFDHPRVPHGPVRRHVLYRISAEQWRERASGAG
jgi:RimJ/RimL family protein N-acetyltransferase